MTNSREVITPTSIPEILATASDTAENGTEYTIQGENRIRQEANAQPALPLTPQQQREAAKARKARKKAQRERAEQRSPSPDPCITKAQGQALIDRYGLATILSAGYFIAGDTFSGLTIFFDSRTLEPAVAVRDVEKVVPLAEAVGLDTPITAALLQSAAEKLGFSIAQTSGPLEVCQ
ncbi:MAG: hypothetical protein AAFV85_26750 [Cyanobacteria bacterium J06634_6]